MQVMQLTAAFEKGLAQLSHRATDDQTIDTPQRIADSLGGRMIDGLYQRVAIEAAIFGTAKEKRKVALQVHRVSGHAINQDSPSTHLAPLSHVMRF